MQEYRILMTRPLFLIECENWENGERLLLPEQFHNLVSCHAAIVAREIGKPCIIGAKIATKVLNDGDMVEVDADNGIVKIIR